MREIKFRAWFELKNIMVESESLVLSYDGEDLFDFAFYKEAITINESMEGTLNFKLMQYTGLKDKNGREIYEGDIVILNSSHKVIEATFEPDVCVVQWRKDSPTMDMLNVKYLDAERKIGLPFDNGMVDEIEVIGNIHENPELLAGDDK